MWHKRTAGIQKKHNAVAPPQKTATNQPSLAQNPTPLQIYTQKMDGHDGHGVSPKRWFFTNLFDKVCQNSRQNGNRIFPQFSEKWKSPPKIYLGVSKNRGTPKWIVYNGKPLLKWDDLGGKPTIFGKHPSDFTTQKLCDNPLAEDLLVNLSIPSQEEFNQRLWLPKACAEKNRTFFGA